MSQNEVQNAPENKMGTMPITKLVINMSLPMILSMLVQAFYNIVDSMYVSRLSEGALTAVSLSFPIQNLMIGFATGTGVGVNALLSRALGEKNPKRANVVAEHGVFLALCCSILFVFVGFFCVRPFLAAQTQIEEIIGYGTDYLQVVCGLSFALYGQVIFERLMQATGRTKYTMYTQGIGAIINIILDPVFIFTPDEFFIGAFGMGVKGAAIATVIGQTVAFIIGVVLNQKKNPDVHLNFKGFRPNWKIVRDIYAIGLPSVLMVAVSSVMNFLMNKILISLTPGRETSATVFGVYYKLNSFVFMPIFGLNNGVIPIIAYNYGARNRLRMVKAIKVSICIAIGFMFVGTVLFELIPQTLLSIFNADAEMTAIGIAALRIIGTHFMVAAVCIVLGSTFQALGFGTYSMIVSIARQIVVLIPAAYLLAKLGLSTGNDTLVWWSFPIAELMSLAVTSLLFVRLYKNTIKPIPEGSRVL